ncbi:MAG: chemotaxis protein CheW [Pseudomonadota bacterium]
MNLPQTLEPTDHNAGTSSVQHLSFRVRQARYALPIEGVREIIEYGAITAVPMMPPFIHGVINLRGNVVPVLDLAARFGFELTQPGKRTCIVIIELEQDEQQQRIGLVVDAVDAVLDIDARDVEPAPPFGAGIRTDFIAGMARDEQGFTIILDVRRVLSLDDIRHLSLAMASP